MNNLRTLFTDPDRIEAVGSLFTTGEILRCHRKLILVKFYVKMMKNQCILIYD